MKKLIGLITIIFAVTLLAPQAANVVSAEEAPRPERRTQVRVNYTIDYAIKMLDLHNRNGNIYSGGVYTALSRQLRKANKLVAKGNLRSARNVLGATVNLLDAQSGKQISVRAAHSLKSFISRIRL